MPQIIDLSVPVNTVGHFDLGGGCLSRAKEQVAVGRDQS